MGLTVVKLHQFHVNHFKNLKTRQNVKALLFILVENKSWMPRMFILCIQINMQATRCGFFL